MLLRVASLPEDPLAAAAEFHVAIVPRVIAEIGQGAACVTLVFAPAEHAHADWRGAAVATLAREAAPARINAVVSDDGRAIEAAAAYIASASGLTGQVIVLDSHGAGPVIRSAS